LIGNQIFRSGTSVASNYRAACRGRSRAEFIAKMGIVEEEADETLFWLEVIEEVEIFNRDSISSLMQECNEILSIVVSSINTARKRK
jgi:four helix bundle protein